MNHVSSSRIPVGEAEKRVNCREETSTSPEFTKEDNQVKQQVACLHGDKGILIHPRIIPWG
jgi:hypothetical protein